MTAEAPHTPLAKVLERRLTTDMESQPDPSAKGKNKVEPEELAAAVDALLGQLEAAHLSTMGTGATGAVPASTAKAVQPAPGMAVHAHAGITKQTNSNAYKGFAGKGGVLAQKHLVTSQAFLLGKRFIPPMWLVLSQVLLAQQPVSVQCCWAHP